VTGVGEEGLVKTLQRSSARFLAWAEQVEVREDDGDHDLARGFSRWWREEMAVELGFQFFQKLEEERRNMKLAFVGGIYRLPTVGDVREVHEIGRDVAKLVVMSSASERKRMRTSFPLSLIFLDEGVRCLGLGRGFVDAVEMLGCFKAEAGLLRPGRVSPFPSLFLFLNSCSIC
jgi:hypothetical protein